MKKLSIYTIILVASIVGLVSCEDGDKNIVGNGLVVKEPRQLSEFSEIQVDGIINVFLRRGESQLVEVESDENLKHLVKVDIIDGSLIISVDENTNFEATKLNAYIRTPSIEKIVLRGITNLTTENTFRQTSLSIDKDNTGNLIFDGDIEYLWLNSYGIGNVNLRGKSDRAIINFASTGDLDASEFRTQVMELGKSGTGLANVWVEKKLNLTLEGVGDVFCIGNPVEVEKEIAGLGRLLIVSE